MKLPGRKITQALKGRALRHAEERSFLFSPAGFSPRGMAIERPVSDTDPQRLKPTLPDETCGAPKDAPFQNRMGKGSARAQRALQTVVVCCAIFFFLGAGDDTARFKDLGHRMMCTCGCGQVLLECNHVGCQSSDKMRNELLVALDRGDNDDLILQGFVQNYGPTVIAAPTATGFNRVAWIMPFVALAFGMAFVVFVVRAWKNKPTPALADGIQIPEGNELNDLRRRARQETEV
jgi:cytochrome c-type biogenesis protein CcmH/NrfF